MGFVIALLSGAFGAGIFSFIQFMIQRKDKKNEQESAERKALRYIMLYIIQERAKELIQEGEATMEEKRSLRQWHDVYHNGLGGNGDADKLMGDVDTLRLKIE